MRQRLHDPGAHVTVERVVAGSYLDAQLSEIVGVQAPRSAHLNAKRLGLIGASNHAAVIV